MWEKYWPLFILLGVGLFTLALLMPGFPGAAPPPPPPQVLDLKIDDLEVGTGPEAKRGSTVKVHYTGWTADTNMKFDSSHGRGKPYELTLGVSSVIDGWHEGIPGMKVGGKRKLTIPHRMAYGRMGKPPIPPNTDLVFDIELVEIVK